MFKYKTLLLLDNLTDQKKRPRNKIEISSDSLLLHTLYG